MADNNISLDSYLRTVGEIINVSSLVDIYMFRTFVVISNIPMNVGRAIYFNLESYPAKRSLITRVAEVTCADPQKVLVRNVLRAGKSANRQRQRISHTPIALASDSESELRQITLRDLQNTFSEIVKERDMQRILTILQGRRREAMESYYELARYFRYVGERH